MKKVWLTLAGAVLTTAAVVPAQATPAIYVTSCDAYACVTYWNVGTLDDPAWIIVNIEPIVRGERNVD